MDANITRLVQNFQFQSIWAIEVGLESQTYDRRTTEERKIAVFCTELADL